ncbi:MAG: glycosyltransferase family 4 protein [Bdellovibrionales bacterium]|nr:glycosyltransferase family 4 protein [Bdellovibrionales bacterium]MBT3525246.1 glycosyltransferase family 4 protein [Bdellovibrionales bacterium]MBT7766774.1 glycosyltransferase family 4 protein [Bdellovibrionales bacterium]
MGLVIGIDATNLRGGGGVTHLVELLTAAEPSCHNISKIIVWGGQKTLSKIPERSWLQKVSPYFLNKGLIARTFWQWLLLSRAVSEYNCHILFVPGGSYIGSFKPVVTMSQNLLPFEWYELRRYRYTLLALKLLILRYSQSRSFKISDGVIFLTAYARQAVLTVTGSLPGQTTVIPHGLSPRFLMKPRTQQQICDYNDDMPFRLIYVSSVDQYKHHWHVVTAVHNLRTKGFSIALDMAGPAYPPALRRLQGTMKLLDPQGQWSHYYGEVPYETLHTLYSKADLGVFASSCENMPNILLETMAAGLPVSCSNCGPMPEMLGDKGLYFNPENPNDIEQTLLKYVLSPKLREEKAQASFMYAKQFLWKCCAVDTFSFIEKVAQQHIK